MLLYSPTYLFLIPGLIFFLIGFISMLILLPGPIKIFNISLDIHPMFIGSLFTLLGFMVINLGLYAKTYSYTEKFEEFDKTIKRFFKYFKSW